MYVSLNWIRDFVDLPRELDPRDLAERLTCTTAEVEGIEPIKIEARGLIVARVVAIDETPGTKNLKLVTLDIGDGKSTETVTAAPAIHENVNLVYAPTGSSVAALGSIRSAKVAGRASEGLILPGDAVGIAMAAQEAVFLDDSMKPGEALDPDMFDDWVIEIDNKSITHRPDLWGHYGIAREIAAIYGQPLKPYPVTAVEELTSRSLPVVEIDIADAEASPRYSGIALQGVGTQPAPLWMQLRLGHVGSRPITGLVDLTNYIMLELGQPMHAFDGTKVPHIEVDWAAEGGRFRTLDGVERTLAADTLMIKCGGDSIALAGVMGGLETEVSSTTETLLLESANFNATVIRRTANRLALRTDASARFEKSLDPNNTVLAIQRFMHLARPMYAKLELASRLSDAYPRPLEPITVSVSPRHVTRAVGRDVSTDEIRSLLTPLGFEIAERDGDVLASVPSYRAAQDVTIEADVIEEVARCIGYDNIAPAMPRVSVRRFEPNALHELEQRTLEYFTMSQGYNEIHGYLWYDTAWLETLGVDPGPCVELANPAAEGLHRMRRTLIPGLLAAVDKNRFYFPTLSIIELGGVFEPDKQEDKEFRHIGLISAQRGKRAEADLYARLKGTIEGWSWQRFTRPATFAPASAAGDRPWEHTGHTAEVLIDGNSVGRISAIDLPLRRRMDEHLSAWSIAWAELRLSGLERIDPTPEQMGGIPEYPLVELDFSVLVDKSTRYNDVSTGLAAFEHPLLRRMRFVGSYEGGAGDKRSLTFRVVLGDETRTLVDDDSSTFRGAFEQFLTGAGYEIRRS